jgi:hypothetical protein
MANMGNSVLTAHSVARGAKITISTASTRIATMLKISLFVFVISVPL